MPPCAAGPLQEPAQRHLRGRAATGRGDRAYALGDREVAVAQQGAAPAGLRQPARLRGTALCSSTAPATPVTYWLTLCAEEAMFCTLSATALETFCTP